MLPTLHRPFALQLEPANGTPGRSREDLFTLRMRYRPEGDWQTHLCVHVPKSLLPAITNCEVESVHLETLNTNEPAARCLPGRPAYLVLGVRTRDGGEYIGIPAAVRNARKFRLVAGVGLVATGGILLWLPAAWLGTMLVVFGTHVFRTGLQVPHNPFTVVREQH